MSQYLDDPRSPLLTPNPEEKNKPTQARRSHAAHTLLRPCSKDGSTVARCFLQERSFLLCERRPHHSSAPPSGAQVEDAPGKPGSFPQNVIRNQKYNPITFIPVVLYEQFKYFLNLYFLGVALSQFVPDLQIGYLFTYIAPLIFVLSVTLLKEAFDDIKRHRRDKEANSQHYSRMKVHQGRVDWALVPSSDLKVGDVIRVMPNERIPADLVLLRTTEKGGATFVRTDQLDGETDWKLRHAVPICQELASDDDIVSLKASVFVEAPKKDIYSFIGNITHGPDDQRRTDPLDVENTLWANTVVASGQAIGLVVCTGRETRAAINTSDPATKIGLVDVEINRLSQVLCVITILLALILIALQGFHGRWWIYIFRFVLLFSSIIPISLRVNLDMGKAAYSVMIMRDSAVAGTVVRSTTIPEELGRISYVFSDKTGTLTQNEMIFKKLHLGISCLGTDSADEMRQMLKDAVHEMISSPDDPRRKQKLQERRRTRADLPMRLEAIVTAISLCHNVTPQLDEETGELNYQASSPDEVALVRFAESMGVVLTERSIKTMAVRDPLGTMKRFTILHVFPFKSETKRMGIIVRDLSTGVICFYLKGADVVMREKVAPNDWLDEECLGMAREGLRTLVFGRKVLGEQQYTSFLQRYKRAQTAVHDRAVSVQAAIDTLEVDLELLGLSGVEDKLQTDVQQTLELLRNAGIRVWMLTGDKVETATCIAISAGLVRQGQDVFQLVVRDREEANERLHAFSRCVDDCVLVTDGVSLQLLMDHFRDRFVEEATKAPAVVCCRCSPDQKAEVTKLVGKHTKLRTCSIGDGGNDVSMIQAAHVGVGIEGKEGKQASLAADFSITQFSHLGRLLLWHGRLSYKRTASLSQFVIQRGLAISVIQAIFSAVFYFMSVAIYNGWLLVFYTTLYTMFPVFSLVMDEDVKPETAMMYPELYMELIKGRPLSYQTFIQLVWQSTYQGGLIMLLAMVLFESQFLSIQAITFTALILTELLNISLEIHRWNRYNVLALLLSAASYFASMLVLRGYFDITFVFTLGFLWKTALITLASVLPIYVVKIIRKKFCTPAYMKVNR